MIQSVHTAGIKVNVASVIVLMVRQMDNKYICNTVGCKNIWEKSVKAYVTIKDVSGPILSRLNFCRECYLKQLAIQYEREMNNG